jgi:tetratricopeptide (TPR) repeat protein
MDLHTHLKKDFGLLVEGGFIAVKQGNRDAAEKLFQAAQLLNPSHTASTIGFGFIALNSMNLQLARKYFEEVLEKEPNNAVAKVYLGFCFILAKVNYKRRPQPSIKAEGIDALATYGTKLVTEALKDTKDAEVKRFGEAVLELSKKSDNYQETPLKASKAKH